MFANIEIESPYFRDFDCRIEAKPVYCFKNILVYQLVNSQFPNDIVRKLNGESQIFRHIALNTKGNGYLFDFENKKLDVSVGKCTYSSD